MSILNKPYTLSLVQDFFTISGEQEGIDDISTQEQVLMKIGSNTMTTPSRAFEPELVEKTNGEVTLSFKMYYRYYDELTGEEVENQLCKYLINERKVNLDYNNKTYQFLIRNIEEDSENKIFSYQLKDASVIELSKSGFELVLDNELMNNSGTITELGDRILEGSRWKVDKEKSDIIVQTIDEALYEYTLEKNIDAIQILDPVYRNDKYQGCSIGNSVNIASGTKIYIFASSYNDKPYRFQFIYTEEEIKKDDNRIILNENCQYYIDNYDYSAILDADEDEISVSIEYRGRRYVFSQMSSYIPNLNRYVYSYTDENDKDNTYYGFIDTEFVSPQIIQNYVSNNTFKSSAGWHGGWLPAETPAKDADKDTKTGKCEAVAARLENGNVITLIDDIANGTYNVETEYTPVLKMEFQGKESVIINNGFYDYRDKFPHGIKEGETYLVRFKIFGGGLLSNLTFRIQELQYNLNNGGYYLNLEEEIFFELSRLRGIMDQQGYYYQRIYAEKTLTPQEIKQKKINFVFSNPRIDETKVYYLQDFQIFPYIIDADSELNFIAPDMQEVTTKIIDHYYINTLDELQKVENIDSLVPVHSETRNPGDKQLEIISTNSKTYIPKYNETAEKIRAISLKESNRFNGIQLLAETFESWPELDSANKKIIFHKYIGTDNYSGFRYGVNLKQIKRTIDSNEIVTKLIVKDNVNELANNGFCSIGKAPSNELRGNVIYNFQYYINKGLLDPVVHQKVLYGKNGVFNKIAETNKEIDKLNEDLLPNLESLVQINSKIILYENTVKAAESDFENTSAALENETGLTLSGLANQDNKGELAESSVIVNYLKQLSEYKATHDEYTKKLEQAKKQKETLQSNITVLEKKIQNQKDIKAAAELKFSELMSAFIQEGTWYDEKYINDELYYIDAQSVMYNSSLPKVSYTIDVLELSQLPGYDMFDFGLGDRTFIEDPEYFGYNEDGSCYRESIVITERKSNLDQPDKNTIKVQNYKTQFQDLFQRITATVQSVQYSEGSYDKAAALAEADAAEKVKFLQEALNDASLILQNAGDQSVLVDINGITITDVDQPSEKIRLVGGGIFLSQSMEDGTQKWTTAITAKGINASIITAGQINTAVVQIMNGTEPTFRWDAFGLTAYEFGTGLNDSYIWDINTKKGVRFDRFGIYGFNGKDGLTWHPDSLKEIDENSTFSLTWDGLKVLTENSLIRIGADKTNEGYSLLIRDKDKNVCFGVNPNGKAICNGDIFANKIVFNKNSEIDMPSSPTIVALPNTSIEIFTEVTLVFSSEPESNLDFRPFIKIISPSSNVQLKNYVFRAIDNEGKVYEYPLNSGNESNNYIVLNDTEYIWNFNPAYDNSILSDITELIRFHFIMNNTNYLFSSREFGYYDEQKNFQSLQKFSKELKLYEAGKIKVSDVPCIQSFSSGLYVNDHFIPYNPSCLLGNSLNPWKNIYCNSFNLGGLQLTYLTLTNEQAAFVNNIKEFQVVSGTEETAPDQYKAYLGIKIKCDNKLDDIEQKISFSLTLTDSDSTTYSSDFDLEDCDQIEEKGENYYFYDSQNSDRLTWSYFHRQLLTENRTIFAGQLSIRFTQDEKSNEYILWNDISNMHLDGIETLKVASNQTSCFRFNNIETVCDFGSSDYKWNTIYCNSVDNSSDKRLKENVENFNENYNAFFDSLKPIHYNFIGKEQIDFGYIAQDIEDSINKFLPANKYTILNKQPKGDDYYYGLIYNNFIALNTWQIQLLKPRVAAAEQKVLELEQKISDLEAQIQNLQNS